METHPKGDQRAAGEQKGKADLTLISGRKELRIFHHSCSVVFEAEKKMCGGLVLDC